MAREICSVCGFSIKTCICDHLQPYQHRIKLTVLQHPSELKSAKNTVKILQLLTSNLDIIQGESEHDFQRLKQRVLANPTHFALLFPSDSAIEINQNKQQDKTLNELLVIDGTWKKAKKIMLLNPWLEQVQQLVLPSGFTGEYGIRKTNISGGLSTIEAIAHSLNLLENADVTSPLNALEGLKLSFTKLMPDEVKTRYKV